MKQRCREDPDTEDDGVGVGGHYHKPRFPGDTVTLGHQGGSEGEESFWGDLVPRALTLTLEQGDFRSPARREDRTHLGHPIPVETREDEEQNVKLTEILELLVAAGYFRARIKGLSPFDKVVGGMTWCITTCNFDVDVDLLFQENSTIGQKIALSEKIVSVLPRMKCPHQLEPHQIQGMDFIHIFPVVQWLVKRAIETKEEMGDYIRSYSISQFQKTYRLPEVSILFCSCPTENDDDFIKRRERAIKTVVDLSDAYQPRRKYKRQQGAEELLDEESRIHATLLEYGRRYGFSRQSKTEKAEDKKTALPTGLSVAEKEDTHEEDELQAAEEQRIQSLMTTMTAMANEESRLTASSVGQIVGLCSAEIKQIVSEYAEKQSELSAEESPEKLGTSQLHRRKVLSLNKQILQKTKRLEELQASHGSLQARYEEKKKTLTEVHLGTEDSHVECVTQTIIYPRGRALNHQDLGGEIAAAAGSGKLPEDGRPDRRGLGRMRTLSPSVLVCPDAPFQHSLAFQGNLVALNAREDLSFHVQPSPVGMATCGARVQLKSYSEKLDQEQAALERIESKADPSILQNLRALVAMNENLKSQEQEFKAHCREEMARLQQEIEHLKAERVPDGDEKVGAPEESSGLLGATVASTMKGLLEG
ncbi:coiled-coil domain-containing protein 93 [Camelus ferus]|nr:coiled-coil domain-containing protein 93 [Camelus ferus]